MLSKHSNIYGRNVWAAKGTKLRIDLIWLHSMRKSGSPYELLGQLVGAVEYTDCFSTEG